MASVGNLPTVYVNTACKKPDYQLSLFPIIWGGERLNIIEFSEYRIRLAHIEQGS